VLVAGLIIVRAIAVQRCKDGDQASADQSKNKTEVAPMSAEAGEEGIGERHQDCRRRRLPDLRARIWTGA